MNEWKYAKIAKCWRIIHFQNIFGIYLPTTPAILLSACPFQRCVHSLLLSIMLIFHLNKLTTIVTMALCSHNKRQRFWNILFNVHQSRIESMNIQNKNYFWWISQRWKITWSVRTILFSFALLIRAFHFECVHCCASASFILIALDTELLSWHSCDLFIRKR